MHQSVDHYKKFSIGDIVELDNGMPDFEEEVGLGVVVAVHPLKYLEKNQVYVHWQKNVWQSGRTQIMDTWEIRHVISE